MKVFTWLYWLALAPTVQVITEVVGDKMGQSTPSIVTVGVLMLRKTPVKVSVYPPLISPYRGLTELTIGV